MASHDMFFGFLIKRTAHAVCTATARLVGFSITAGGAYPGVHEDAPLLQVDVEP